MTLTTTCPKMDVKWMSYSFPGPHPPRIKVCSWSLLTSLKNKHVINSNIFYQITLEYIWQKSACINIPELWLLQTKLTTKLKHFCVTHWRQKGGRGKVSITMHSWKEPLNINKHVIFTSDCRAGKRAFLWSRLLTNKRSKVYTSQHYKEKCIFFLVTFSKRNKVCTINVIT